MPVTLVLREGRGGVWEDTELSQLKVSSYIWKTNENNNKPGNTHL